MRNLMKFTKCHDGHGIPCFSGMPKGQPLNRYNAVSEKCRKSLPIIVVAVVVITR